MHRLHPEPGAGRAGPGTRRRRQDGQSLVEFALVIPIFMLCIVAIAEFALMFTAYMSTSFASRDAVQVAAELGDSAGADGVILRRIEQDVSPPARREWIKEVRIYQADAAGNQVGGATVYTRGGSTTFTYPGPVYITVPYTKTSGGYPESSRCNVLVATTCTPPKTQIDTLGVRISYQYEWGTPFPGLISGSGTGPLMIQSNMMRLEPVR